MSGDICFLPATELARRIAARELSVLEVIETHLARIERINPSLNAIVTLLPAEAIAAARAADRALAAGEACGPLHGLPIAHKDTIPTAGIRTTYGSPIFASHVPGEDALMVERLRNAGAITIGKTNAPEFGLGSQTYNAVFGATANPYDTSTTCGGSTGGTAVALATGMMPIGDGGDMGGSLRNPASFCNVVGFRTAPGRVPIYPSALPWRDLSVQGPMARTVEDVALLLSVMAGPDPRVPIAIDVPGDVFRAPLERDFAGRRIALSADLGGLPVDRRVRTIVEAQRSTFEDLGCVVDDACPDFEGADEAFKAWRAWGFEATHGRYLETDRERLKPDAIWNAEQGRALSGPDLARAEIARGRVYHRVREFMETHEFLVLPVSQVPPFSIEETYVAEINGVAMDTYIDWMRSCYFISVTGLPAISVPAGFTAEGLPVGIQIVGRHHDELGVLQLAYAFEQATRHGDRRPAGFD